MKRFILTLVFILGLCGLAKGQYGQQGGTFTGGTVPDSTTFTSLVTLEGGLTVTGGVVTINVAVTINATLDLDPTAATITAVYRVAHIQGTLTTTSGTGDVYGLQVAPKSVTINSGNVHSVVASVFISEPDITETSGSVTTGASLYIEGAPTEGTGNGALIVALGNVGIGTTSPTAALTVGDGVASGGGVLHLNRNADPNIEFQVGGTIVGRIQGGTDGGVDRLDFIRANGASPAYLSISITNGEVGIGTDSPDNPLELFSTTTPQFRITNTDATDYLTIGVDTDGKATFTTVDGGGTGGHIVFLPDGNVGIGTASPSTTLDVNGTITQETFVITKVVSLTGATDNTATNFFTITTTDESGSADGGSYYVEISLLASEGVAASGATNVAVKGLKAAFNRVMASAGTGANSAMAEINEPDEANQGTGTIATVTLTVVETSEFVQTIQLLVDTSGGTFDGFAQILLVYNKFTTAPVIAGI